MEKKWRKFERLVAAIHHTEEKGAEVKWHDIIDGREFDVTIRFRHHSYKFLTVIECRDYATSVPVGDVEAFVTKSRDVHANKAVMVAASGFQSGGKEVAKRHNIELFTLKEEEELPDWFIVKALTPAISILNVRVLGPGGHTISRFSNDANVLTYYMAHANMRAPGVTKSLAAFVEDHRTEWEAGTTDEAREWTLSFPKKTKVDLPFADPTSASAISFTTQLVTAKIIETGGLDPNIISPQYRFTNVLTDESNSFGGAQVKLGFDTELKSGQFYNDPSTGFNYYVEKIDGDLATIQLLESYQHGQFLQAVFTQKLKHAKYFIDVTDPVEITRLQNIQRRTTIGRRAQPAAAAASVVQVGRNDPCPCGSSKKFKRCHGR